MEGAPEGRHGWRDLCLAGPGASSGSAGATRYQIAVGEGGFAAKKKRTAVEFIYRATHFCKENSYLRVDKARKSFMNS